MRSPATSHGERLCLSRTSLQAKLSLTAKNANKISKGKEVFTLKDSTPAASQVVSFDSSTRNKQNQVKLDTETHHQLMRSADYVTQGQQMLPYR